MANNIQIGDLVLGWGDDNNLIIGMVVDIAPLAGFKPPYNTRWYVEWPDGLRSAHVTSIVKMMKEDLKRHLNE